MNEGDVYIPLADFDELGGESRENEFISDLYNDVVVINHRKREIGVYRSDFLFDTFHITINGRTFWWMSPHHPISIMLEDNGFKPEETNIGRFGCSVVYANDLIQQALDTLVGMCKKHKLIIIPEEE